MKGHNYGTCRKCGLLHKHPRGMKGKSISKETKEKIRKANIKTHKKIKYGFQKGHKHSKIWEKAISLALKGRTPWNKGLTKETDERVKLQSDLLKVKHKKGLLQNFSMKEKTHSSATKIKMRNSTIKYIETIKLNGMPLAPRMGKYEKPILDKLEKAFCYKILRQYRVAGYFLDGYCPMLNMAIEVDEPYHNIYKKQKERDIEKQKIIEQELNCRFLRIKIPEMLI